MSAILRSARLEKKLILLASTRGIEQREMGDVEVETHPAGEEGNMQEIQHEMNPDMGHHDASRPPPDQASYPGSEGNFGGQPQEGQPQEGKI